MRLAAIGRSVDDAGKEGPIGPIANTPRDAIPVKIKERLIALTQSTRYEHELELKAENGRRVWMTGPAPTATRSLLCQGEDDRLCTLGGITVNQRTGMVGYGFSAGGQGDRPYCGETGGGVMHVVQNLFLADNPERPEVRFTEAACVQCGICVVTCPEKVIALEPRYDFTTACLEPQTLHFEEPFHCIRCQKPFGTKSSIERVVKRLEGHSMFQGADKLTLIQMCDTCRIEVLSESPDDPFRGPARPRIRTTDDYVAAQEAAKRTGRKAEDFLD